MFTLRGSGGYSFGVGNPLQGGALFTLTNFCAQASQTVMVTPLILKKSPVKKHKCVDTLLFQSLIWPPGWPGCLLGLRAVEQHP